MAKWHVLLVEDDPDGQDVVSRILHHHDITADVAGTAEVAVDMLASSNYDLAIIDLALPQADGWSLLQHIKSIPELTNLPCVAVTAFHSAEVAVKAVQAGFSAYLPKPLNPGSFVSELERVYS